jgi:hypothetical protein
MLEKINFSFEMLIFLYRKRLKIEHNVVLTAGNNPKRSLTCVRDGKGLDFGCRQCIYLAGIEHRASGIEHPASSIRHRASGTEPVL